VGDTTGRGGPAPPATIYGALGELDQIDQAVYRAIAATPSPSLDFVLSRLSSAADHSKLWFALAGALALATGGPALAGLREKFPTGALTTVELHVERWRDLDQGTGTAINLVTPRSLESGPET
jgi:hypothetical protein